jgi:hypothetical protein
MQGMRKLSAPLSELENTPWQQQEAWLKDNQDTHSYASGTVQAYCVGSVFNRTEGLKHIHNEQQEWQYCIQAAVTPCSAVVCSTDNLILHLQLKSLLELDTTGGKRISLGP